MTKSIKIFFFLALFLSAQNCLAQSDLSIVEAQNQYTIENITVSNGLYSNYIFDVLQDYLGFLWLASDIGLQKYDGYTFTLYTPDTSEVTSSKALRLFEDSNRNLWALMKEGLVRYQRESDNFVKYCFINDKKDTISYVVTAIAEDLNGNVCFWIYGKGLFKIDNSKNSFIPYAEVNELYDYDLNNLVRCMVFDPENNLWIGMNSQGLLMINHQKGITKKYLANPNVRGSLSNNTVTASLRDENGELWFGTSSGLNRYYADKNLFENYFIDPSNPLNTINRIYRMTDDGEGNIWTISSDNVNGIGRFNKLKKEFTHYSKGMNANISSVTTDRSGIVWLGNWFQGIYKVDPNPKKFSAFSIKRDGNDILDGKIITPVYEDQNGEIWFGGNLDGLYRYNKQTGKISLYKIEGGNFDSSVENYILDIFQDSKGNFWIGTSGGLCFFNSENGNFKHIQQPNSADEGLGRTSKIIEDSNGILWIVTMNGFLVQLDPETYRTEYFIINGRQLKFRDLIADEQGFLWIGSAVEGGEGAVLKFDLSKKELSFVKQLDKINIISFCYDNGILWCGSVDAGIIRYDIKADTKTIVTTNNGLISNSILGLETDESGNIWLSSPRGLTRYNPGNETFNHYFKEDGFFTNEFTYRAYFKSQNGDMIFGSIRGIVKFNPDSIKNSEYLPPIVLTDLKVENKSIGVGKNSPLNKHISIIDIIELAHDKNDIAITFASLDFRHPERIKYSFYLENFEDDWRTPVLEHTAYYTNLDPGEYIFKVKGTNSDGVWNEAGTSVKIIILPPWWATWWAYTTYGCFIFGLLYGLRRYELNRQNLKHSWELERVETEKYQEIDRMKSRFFANISHEFRTPLTLIKGPIQQMLFEDFSQNVKKQFKMVLRNTNRLMQLINQLLDLSKVDSGEMILKASPEDIVPLVNGLTQSFESLAKQKNIELQFQSSDEEVVVYIDRDKFEKIIINLLSNALKFTPEGGSISVKINVPAIGSSTFVEIIVSNTGPGILPEQFDKIFDRFYQVDDSSVRKYEGTGIGLSLTKELVELHHGKIKVESDPGKETTFTVYLPLGKNHLQPEEIVETPTKVLSDIKIDSDLIESAISSKSKTEAAHQPTEDSSTLLIVEDNADMRSYMRESLESNYKIIEAENGEEGIRQSLEYSPDMIISDVMMPKMDGFQFCAEIKKDERTSHIPVILLTAKASGESRIEGLETGADDYLTKPFDTRELKVRINNLIEQRRKLQEKFRKEIIVSPKDITVTSIDEQLVQRAIDVVEKNIRDPNFDTTVMAKEVGISRMLLNTKLKALTGLPTGEFIRTLRLKRAAQLLQQGYGNVTDVAYEVGFQSLSYFAKAFKEQFGKSPSQYSTKV